MNRRPLSRDLTFRERQIIDLLREAKANKEIAFELSLTEGTVKYYIYNIFQKLGVKNRTQLALWSQARVTTQQEMSGT